MEDKVAGTTGRTVLPLKLIKNNNFYHSPKHWPFKNIIRWDFKLINCKRWHVFLKASKTFFGVWDIKEFHPGHQLWERASGIYFSRVSGPWKEKQGHDISNALLGAFKLHTWQNTCVHLYLCRHWAIINAPYVEQMILIPIWTQIQTRNVLSGGRHCGRFGLIIGIEFCEL